MYRLIFIFFLVIIVYWLIKRALVLPQRKSTIPKDQGEEMVQDPVCKSYVTKNQSYSLSYMGNRLYFCSEECFRKYMSSHALPKP